MPKLLAYFIIFFIITGCNKEKISTQNYALQTDVSLGINQTYKEILAKGISTEGGFTIITQAKHFITSEIIINSNGLELQYIYTPQKDFVGEDVVVLKNCISIGGSNCDQIELFKFTFHIK